MNEYQNEYTNEYQETVHEKKNTKIALKVFIVGTIISLIICGIGLYKQIDAGNKEKKAKEEAITLSTKKVEQAKIRLQEIEKQYNELKTQYAEKENECNTINTKMGIDNDWYTKSSKCMQEKSEIQYKMSNLEMEDSEIKNTDYTVYYSLVDPLSYKIFYYIGAGVFGANILISLIFYLATRKK